MSKFRNVCLHIFDNLDHQYSIVTFCSQSSVCCCQVISKFIYRQISLSSASLYILMQLFQDSNCSQSYQYSTSLGSLFHNLLGFDIYLYTLREIIQGQSILLREELKHFIRVSIKKSVYHLILLDQPPFFILHMLLLYKDKLLMLPHTQMQCIIFQRGVSQSHKKISRYFF